MKHVDDQLPDYALGALGDEEMAEVEAHLEICPRCAADALATQEALATFAWAVQPPVNASAEGRTRLLRATRPLQSLERFDHVDRLAKFFDLGMRGARALLEKAADPKAWVPGPVPGLLLLHLPPGPTFAGADAGLVRIEGGVRFPMHTHLGAEHTLLLEGGVTYDDGSVMRPGDHLLKPPGSRHGFEVFPEGCLFALILYTGVEIDGVGKLTARE